MPAVPVMDDAELQDAGQPLPAVPYIPEPLAAPTPAPAPELSEPERQRAIKRSRLRLEAATTEVERQQPTLEKVLAATGLNLRESAAGATKQALGNAIRTYTDVVAPETPHQPGTFKYYLQYALKPFDTTGQLLGLSDVSDPNSLVNVLRETGKLTAAEGTQQLKAAQAETEQLGGGPLVSGAAAFASTAGASAPALLAAPLGLPAASIAAGLQSYGQNIDQFKERLMELDPKLTEQQAFDKAMLPAAMTGAATGILTQRFGGVEKLIGRWRTEGLGQTGIKASLKDIFKSALLEFPEEFLDQLSQGFTEKAFIDPNKSTKEIFDDATLAGLQGLALGGLTGAAIHGVEHGRAAAVAKIEQAVERSKLRREIGPEGTAAIRRVVEAKGRPYGEGEIQTAGRLLAQPGQPAVAGPEGEAQAGAAQRGGTRGEEQAALPPVKTTTDIVQQAVDEVYPKPAPPKQAVFGGYLYDNPNLPTYKIPGVRPGISRDVSAATARQYGYQVPEQIPTFEQWKQAGSPVGEAQVAAAPAQQRIPIQIKEADGKIVQGEFNGYYDMREINGSTPVSIGKVLDNGKMSHGLLRPGEEIIGTVPSFDEWTAQQSQVSRSAAAAASPQERAASPLDWKEFSHVDDAGYRVIDDVKLRSLIETGQIRGGTASEALLLHMLKQSELHPRNAIKLIDMTPDQLQELARSGFAPQTTANRAAASGAYKGLFATEPGSPNASIEIVTRESDGRPISQQEFVRLMVHELGHNNVTSKLRFASPELQQAAHSLFMFVVEKTQGTVWESHNATSNLDEFLSEAMSTPGFQKFLTQLDYSGRATTAAPALKQSVWGQVLGIIKRILKLPDFITTLTGKKVDVITALDEALNLSSQLETVRRGGGEAQQAQAPGTPPILGATPPVLPSPELTQAQIAGGAAEVGRIANEIYAHREQGIAALEGLSYERKQFRMARTEIKRLNDLATAGFIQQGLDPEQFPYPDPTAGVGISEEEDENGMRQISADSTFSDALTVAGVAHDPANVGHLQEELYYEQAAHRLNNLKEQISTLTQAAEYYGKLGVAPEEISKVEEQITKLQESAEKLASAELDGRSVSERAGEINTADALRQERIAQRNALSLEPVGDFFGRQVGAYRQFAQQAKAGLDLALATKNAVNDPAALRAATLAADQWIALPTDIRNAILVGRPVTMEQKAVIFSSLAQVFEEFDFAYSRMKEQLDSRVPAINKEIRLALGKIADAKIQSGMGQVLLSDVLSTLDGETGATGTLKSLQETQALRERISAISHFATTLALAKPNATWAQTLFDWIANPSKAVPTLPPETNAGVDTGTLNLILREVQRNPAFGSSLLTLMNASDKKLQSLPITGLQQIEKLLELGTPEAQAQAEAVGARMLRQARAQSSLGAAALRDALSQLDALEIERRSLQEGRAMFDQMAASPEFRATRDAVQNSPFGLVEPMVPQNHIATTFKAFGAPGLPSHPELVLGADRDTNFKADWFKKVAEWHRTAQEYLDHYDVVAAAYANDTTGTVPSPQQLGFDIPKVRGLRDATQRFVPGSFLELSLNTEGGRWKVPWLARFLSRTALFRQHDFVSKMVGGIAGTDLRARLADFVNHYLIAQGIRDKYKDIPDKLHRALRSHPEFGMNIANYREFWNELAHWGRMFGSPVKAGMKLPRSGRIVTDSDITLLQRERAYEEELRRRVTETNPTLGIRVNVPGRTLVRPGAYVGDEGLPRFPGRRADAFIADSLAAYNVPPPPGAAPGTPPTVRAFGPVSNLGPTSSEPVVAFWNQNPQLLVQHILDVRRTDRQMVLSPSMAQAESDLATDWIVNGVKPVQSVDDLVNQLVKYYPTSSNPDVNPRDEVINGLNAELRQYRDAAQRVATERAERDQARQGRAQIAFSADNEFTKPAAKLELPSALYDYGALSPGEHLAITSRANHERIIAYATAVQRAITELQSRINRYEKGEIDEKTAAQSYGGNVTEMQDVLNTLKKIQNDFDNAYSMRNLSSNKSGVLNDTLGLLTSAILALPTVGLRNMTQGQFEVYAMSRAMGTAGHWLTAARTLKQLGKTLVRFGLHLGEGLVKHTNIGAALITGTNRHIFEDAVHKFSTMIAGEDLRAVADKIGELGMDGRDSFLQRLGRIWQQTSEFISREEFEKTWPKSWPVIGGRKPVIGGRKIGAIAAVPANVIRAFFDKIGVNQYDFAINSAALSNAELVASRLKQVADVYGKAREGLGPFDPTNRAFDLKPAEWATGKEAADTLANMRQVLEGSVSPEGFQLERGLWDFYQKKKANEINPQMFTERQMDALQRRILADMNASTPANRPSSASAHGIMRNLLLLQGYPSDMMLKIINGSWGHARDRGTLANGLVKTPTIAMLALVAVLIGYITSAVTGRYEKYLRGRMPSLATPLDADFWTNWKRFAEGTLALGAAQFGYLGDFVLAMMGEIRGNRGFDPTGRILTLSLATRTLTALRGAYNTAKGAGTARDAIVPLLDVGRSLVPFWLEAERVLGQSQGAIKQDERVRRGEAQTQGLLEGRGGFTPPSYGPTTVVRRNLGDDVSKWYEAQQAGDTRGAAAALADAKVQMAKLEEYHYRKYLAAGKDEATAREMAQRDTWNDYQEINPAVSSLLGRRPTAAQNDLILSGITGDRRRVVDQGDNAWKAGAQALFGRPGAITREEVAAGRGGGGGGGRAFSLPGSRVFNLPSASPSRRRAALGLAPISPIRAVRSRIRRRTEAPFQAVRRGTRAVSNLLRRQRGRRPLTIKPPRFRKPRVTSRRRRDYALG